MFPVLSNLIIPIFDNRLTAEAENRIIFVELILPKANFSKMKNLQSEDGYACRKSQAVSPGYGTTRTRGAGPSSASSCPGTPKRPPTPTSSRGRSLA